MNSENGYEYLRGHPTERQQVHHTDKVRRSAWRIVCAGGYFAALPFWRMQPFAGVTGDAVALAGPGKVHVVYLPHGGETKVNFVGAQALSARWFNPRTGGFGEPFRVAPTNQVQDFSAPDTNDWALLVESTTSP